MNLLSRKISEKVLIIPCKPKKFNFGRESWVGDYSKIVDSSYLQCSVEKSKVQQGQTKENRE